LSANVQGQNNYATCRSIISASMERALSAVSERECYTTCKYANSNSTYITINMNTVTFGCCCTGPVNAYKQEYGCSNCPGQYPVCPEPEEVC
jgi:hypothetical protein